ncbi:MAG: hypothetical protein U0169_25790 [Polyangiaceae bacterium]
MFFNSRILIGAALALGISGLFASSACSQPKVKCITARGDFAAKFTLKSGTGACAELKGDTIGFQSYNPTGGPNGTPDFSKASVAIVMGTLGNYQARAEQGDTDVDAEGKPVVKTDPNPDHHTYSLGDFTTADPADDGFCTVSTTTAAEQVLPEIKEIPADPDNEVDAVPGQPAISAKVEWANVRVFVNANAIGTQFSADLKYSENGCTAEYSVYGLYPAHSCENAKGELDDAECSPVADPDAGRRFGSGINPDFPVACDKDLKVCMITSAPPAFKPGVEK